MNMVISDYIVRQIMEDDERRYFLGMAKGKEVCSDRQKTITTCEQSEKPIVMSHS